MEWLQSSGVIIAIVIGFIAIIGFFTRHENRLATLKTMLEIEMKHVNDKLKGMADKIEGISETMNTLRGIQALLENPAFVKLVSPSPVVNNPYSIEEKKDLIEKYRNNTITLEEARRLREILNEDLKRKDIDITSGFAIALLLIGLGALIAYLLSKE